MKSTGMLADHIMPSIVEGDSRTTARTARHSYLLRFWAVAAIASMLLVSCGADLDVSAADAETSIDDEAEALPSTETDPDTPAKETDGQPADDEDTSNGDTGLEDGGSNGRGKNNSDDLQDPVEVDPKQPEDVDPKDPGEDPEETPNPERIIRIVEGPAATVVGETSFHFNYRTNDVCGTGSFSVAEAATGRPVGSFVGEDICYGPLHGGYPGLSSGVFSSIEIRPATTYLISISVRGTASDGTRTAGTGSATASLTVTTKGQTLPVGEFNLDPIGSNWKTTDEPHYVAVAVTKGGSVTLTVTAPCFRDSAYDRGNNLAFRSSGPGTCIFTGRQAEGNGHAPGPDKSVTMTITDPPPDPCDEDPYACDPCDEDPYGCDPCDSSYPGYPSDCDPCDYAHPAYPEGCYVDPAPPVDPPCLGSECDPTPCASPAGCLDDPLPPIESPPVVVPDPIAPSTSTTSTTAVIS